MKKLITLMLLLFLTVSFVVAQKTVTGTISDQAGIPLIGANITEKGTSNGTITDIDGNFSIEVAEDAIIVVSYTGFQTQEINTAGASNFTIQLAEGTLIDEVVVTALGIRREEKSLGYSVQQLGGEDLVTTQSNNIVTNLAGNISGVQVIGGAGSSIGGSARIRIRGVNGLTSGQPLFVVDGTPISNANFSGSTAGSDFGNLASDINPEDVDKISVLKGPSATALYGNRAKDGVVLITLKKGAKSKGLGVTASSSVTADKVYILPAYQNEYAGGYDQNFIPVVDPVDGQTYNTLLYAADESWGPRMDGTTYRPWWSWFPGPDYGQTQALSPQPDNVRNFFDTGITNQNSVSLTGGGDVTTFRLSYSNVNQTGVFPNSKFVKNSVGMAGSYNITDKVTVSTNLNVLANDGRGRPEFGYNGKNPANSFNQWFQRQIDMDRLRDYYTEGGLMKSWNIRSATNLRPQYWDNPFYIQYQSFNTDSRSRYYGNVSLNVQLTDALAIKGTVHRDDYTQRIEQRNGSESLDQSFYSEFVAQGREDNYEVLMTYAQELADDITLDANLGGNIRKNDYHSNNGSTVGGLNVPNLFTLSASTDRPNLSSFISEKQVNSVFAAANFGYKNFLYVGATIRNDWSSALSPDNNSYLYPSVSGSLVFSELMNSSIFSFGKIRASWAQVGADVDAYSINPVYGSGNPYGSNPVFSLPNTIIDPNLKPSLSTSWEAGIDLKFLNNRLGVDFTYYTQDSKDEILNISIPGATGYSNALINAGLFRSQGWEVALNLTPFDRQNLTWDMSFNFSHNTSKVVELYEDLTNYKLADAIGGAGWGGLSVNAFVGEEWGTLNGRGYTYDANGNTVVSSSGAYTVEAGKNLGSVLPDYTGGFRSSVKIGNLDISGLIDFQIGGKFFSVSRMFGAYSGLTDETVGNNDKGNPVRDAVDAGGGVGVEGVLASGESFSTYVNAVTFYGRTFGLHERYIYDATYVKWRELAVGYTLPSSLFSGTALRRVRLAAILKNPLLIHSKVPGIDPSEILPGSNGIVFEERGGLPGTRSFGLKLDITL